MQTYTKPKLLKGQGHCEGCGNVFIEWSLKPIMFEGRFYMACKKCCQKHSIGQFTSILEKSNEKSNP